MDSVDGADVDSPGQKLCLFASSLNAFVKRIERLDNRGFEFAAVLCELDGPPLAGEQWNAELALEVCHGI